MPISDPNIQPIFCLAGLIFPQRDLNALTADFLKLKREFSPNIAANLSHNLEIMLHEIKGSSLRSDIRSTSRNRRRYALRMLDRVFDLLEHHNCMLLARAYVKKPGAEFDGRAVYTTSVQYLCKGFQKFLENKTSKGIIIADSRNNEQNARVSFSVFTEKYKSLGDAYPNLLEMPTFGHSENHVGLQMTDWVASSVLFPIISYVYCLGHITNIHVRAEYAILKTQFSRRLNRLQYRYHNGQKYQGGITIYDGILESRSATWLFK